MKKILFLIPSIVGGGAERVMVTLANGLSKKYDVEILALTNTESFYAVDDTVKISGIGCSVNKKNAITKFFTRFRSAFKGFFGIKRAIKEKKTGCCYCISQSHICTFDALKNLQSP